MSNKHSPRWALLQRLDIPSAQNASQVYLRRRRLVQTPMFGILWHHIFLPDSDRDPHDHPWPFWTFIVRGGYSEVVFPSPETTLDDGIACSWSRFSWHSMPIGAAHRVMAVTPGTITLVLTGRRSRDWGFWTKNGFMPWRSYDRSAAHGPDPFDSSGG